MTSAIVLIVIGAAVLGLTRLVRLVYDMGFNEGFARYAKMRQQEKKP